VLLLLIVHIAHNSEVPKCIIRMRIVTVLDGSWPPPIDRASSYRNMMFVIYLHCFEYYVYLQNFLSKLTTVY
jgi:hypothetical protein